MNDSGMLELFEITPGCTERYVGDNADERIYVVGRGTAHERLFVATALAAASEHSRAFRLSLSVAVASQLCATAVQALRESASGSVPE